LPDDGRPPGGHGVRSLRQVAFVRRGTLLGSDLFRGLEALRAQIVLGLEWDLYLGPEGLRPQVFLGLELVLPVEIQVLLHQRWSCHGSFRRYPPNE
jgi:hypothetical protein